MTYWSEVLADSPLVLLKMDETSGTAVVDYGSRAINGTYENGVTLNQSALTSEVTVSAQFDGSNDFVNVPDAADLEITGDVTLEVLIYPTSFANYRMLITKSTGDVGPYQWMLFNGSGIPSFRNGSGTDLLGSRAPILNKWNHMAVVRSGGFIQHYLDGSPNGVPVAVVGTPTANSEALRFGRRSDGFYFPGKAAGMAVYSYALSADRILAHALQLPGNARLTSLGAEVVVTPNPSGRVSQLSAEVIVTPIPNTRVTMLPVEVVAMVKADARLTQTAVEVVYTQSTLVAPTNRRMRVISIG